MRGNATIDRISFNLSHQRYKCFIVIITIVNFLYDMSLSYYKSNVSIDFKETSFYTISIY